MTEVIVIDSRDGVVCPHTPHVDGQGPSFCLRVVLPDVGEVLIVVKSTYKQGYLHTGCSQKGGMR